jgi:ADP-ribosylglycohydrolase
MSISIEERAQGALAGLLIADALAMPVHWYYDTAALHREYGRVTDLLAPRSPHSGSIMWRSSYEAPNARGEILHDQRRYWGQRGVHYHQNLKAGENTLTAQLARLAIRLGSEPEGYSPDRYLEAYIAFMTTPGKHRDTYVEECHRGFFTNYANGVPPRRCAVKEKHIGGLTPMLAVALLYRNDPVSGRRVALEHLALTHAGEKMEQAGSLILDLLYEILAGRGLRNTLENRLSRQDHPLLGHPYRRLLESPDEAVIGPRFSSACYLEDSVPSVLYLALKYHDRPEAALIANTNLGGENVHRGSVLGCLLGAEHGLNAWPARWLQSLAEPVPELPDSGGPGQLRGSLGERSPNVGL